jgi:hypothetical protein
MMPAVMTKGIKHGILDNTMILTDLNKIIPTNAINSISINKLSNKLSSR